MAKIVEDRSYIVRQGRRVPLTVLRYGTRAVVATSPDGETWISAMTARDTWGPWRPATLTPQYGQESEP